MTWYRNSFFMLKGIREYTRQGYMRAAADFSDTDLQVDCSGRSVMVTGANSGVGRALSEALARRGATVHMVCRNEAAAREAAAEISSATDNQRVHVHVLDLSRPRQVAQFTRQFCRQHQQLHVLVNNAGCMVHEWRASGDDDALETNFATNTLAVHMLVRGLEAPLAAAGRARVLVVSSAGMLTQSLRGDQWQAPADQPLDGTSEYALNKRQQVVMAERYSARWPAVKFFSLHPGWADTPAVRSAMPEFHSRMKDRLRSAEQGADTALWLAISEAAYEHESGLFFQDRRPVAKHLPLACTRSSAELEDSLMKYLDQLYDKYSSE